MLFGVPIVMRPCKSLVKMSEAVNVAVMIRRSSVDQPSRIQVASKHKGRGLHFVCSTRVYKFYEEAKDEAGKMSLVDEQMVKQLASLKLI